MFVKKLRFYNFRNLENAEIEFDQGINFLIGPNGQGKTNLLEGLDLLASGKSFRTNTSKDLIAWGSSSCSVFGDLLKNELNTELGLIINSNSKEVWKNQNRLTKTSELLGNLLAVTFSPDDIMIVKAEPDLRRNFIDKHLVQIKPIILESIINYKKALKSKNLLLKNNPKKNEINTWNEILALEGTKIKLARLDFLAILEEQANLLHIEYSGTKEQLNLKLKTNFSGNSVDDNYKLLEKNIEREIFLKKSLIGTHRDDIIFSLGNVESRSFASQGQARSLILSLKLAVIKEIETNIGESPIILLDDVDAELDNQRSQRFFDLILSEKNQIFVTGTELRRQIGGKERPANVLLVNSGEVRRNY